MTNEPGSKEWLANVIREMYGLVTEQLEDPLMDMRAAILDRICDQPPEHRPVYHIKLTELLLMNMATALLALHSGDHAATAAFMKAEALAFETTLPTANLVYGFRPHHDTPPPTIPKPKD